MSPETKAKFKNKKEMKIKFQEIGNLFRLPDEAKVIEEIRDSKYSS